MTTNLENNTISRVNSLEFQDSNKKVNRNGNSNTPALMKSKRGISTKTNNSIKQTGLTSPLPFSKNTTPRDPVSVSFAVDQWFRILLVHMHKQNVSFLDNLAVPFEAKSLKINI